MNMRHKLPLAALALALLLPPTACGGEDPQLTALETENSALREQLSALTTEITALQKEPAQVKNSNPIDSFYDAAQTDSNTVAINLVTACRAEAWPSTQSPT